MRFSACRTTLAATLIAGLTAGGALSGAPASAAPRPATLAPVVSATDWLMARQLSARATTSAFGAQFSGQVLDLDTGAVRWQRGASRLLKPASTTKLVTAMDALAVYGPSHRFATSVRRGSYWSHVVLAGGGDPSLTPSRVSALAASTAARLRLHGVRSVKVWYDDSLLPRPVSAYGWKLSDVPREVVAVRALAIDGREVADTSRDAANAFAARLRASHLVVRVVGRSGAPAGAPLLARVRGARLDAIVRHMLLASDNDDAELLHRLVAVRVGRAATWTGAAAARRSVLAAQGLSIDTSRLYDGSGLSRAGRLSAASLVQVLAHSLDPAQTSLTPAVTGLPVSGVSGTLMHRYTTAPSRCAAGLVHAKTGTLNDTVALAGWARGADGHVKVFAFVVNGRGDSLALKRRVDGLAATVTGCY